jgi:hypothetical protein
MIIISFEKQQVVSLKEKRKDTKVVQPKVVA